MARPKAQTYAELAAEITEGNPPPWLIDLLEQLAPNLAIDRKVRALQPSKTEMRKRMLEISEAAKVIQSALEDGAVWEFLETEGGPIGNLGALDKSMRTISERAALAALSDRLGRGRGKALPQQALAPEILCAAIVAELWNHFHDTYPRPGHGKAHAIADDYWRLSGGISKRNGGSEPLSPWRYHFGRADALAKSTRAQLRHHLKEVSDLQATWGGCK